MRKRIYLAFFLAVFGMVLSLYFGEIVKIEPCRLCWYQRVCLFPMSLILGLAIYKQEEEIASSVKYLAAIGFLFAFYQVLEPHLWFLQSEAICGERAGCIDPVFLLFGFLTFPMLSLLGFFLIFALLL